MSSTSGVSGSSQQSILLQLMQQLRQAQAQKTGSSSDISSTSSSSSAADAISQFFQTADTDGNGELSQSELTSGLQSSGSLLSGSNLLQASTSSSGDTAQDAIKALISSIQSALQSADSSSTTGTDKKTEFQQALFKQLDGNGDGSITKDEVESAVTKAGGSTAAADALYAKLDPDNTGSVSEQQFAANLPKPPHGHHHDQSADGSGDTAFDAIKSLLDSAAQSSSDTANNQSGDPRAQFAQNLFSQLDTDGDGSISKSDVESAVTKAGGTTAAADALYAKLDPDNTGSVSEQQFAQNLPPPPHGGAGGPPPGGGGQQASSSDSSSGSGSYDPLDTNQDGTVSLAERLAGLGITLDGSSNTDSSSTDTGTENKQGLFAQLRSQTLNFLISLQSGSGNSAAA